MRPHGGDCMSRQAIVTKYIGPSNHRGSRVKAFCEAGEFTMPWDCELSPEQNHMKAMVFLCGRLGRDSRNYAMGSLPANTGYVFVEAERVASMLEVGQ